ncbi:uncharacterized protein Elal [Calliphora vicina]|uniref:uncharacterized protein Elal n=1 Tax=Calliphora vicina TaxID=7373 RepID=UPI00325AE732
MRRTNKNKMFIINLKMHRIILALAVSLFVIQTTNAGYTSEETDEKSKSLYSAVTSILGSTESSKHHQKHIYDSPPCASGGCSGALSPCNSATGCSHPTGAVYNSGIGYSANQGVHSAPSVYTNGGYAPSSEHVNLPAVPPPSHAAAHRSPLPYQAPSGIYVPTVSGNGSPYRPPISTVSHQGGYASTGYTNPGSPAPYPHWNSNPSQYGYHGPRGYSVYDHSLKTNSEYTEVGTHTGPLQQANNGYGYGSGYGGGYNGLFNRPGF